MSNKIENINEKNAVIKVIGIGGGGGNAILHMMNSNINDIDFYSVNTDNQALNQIDVFCKQKNKQEFLSNYKKVLIGSKITKGLGAGAKPEIGKKAVEENIKDIKKIISGADMIFLTAGMGGGTGTGGIPVIAKVAKEMGILTIAIVTKPFCFEGLKRSKYAEDGIKNLANYVDSLIVIPNEKLISISGRNSSLVQAFKNVDNVLKEAVEDISSLIISPGTINVDFADVKTVMSSKGMALMGCGVSDNPHERAKEAAKMAISSHLLEQESIKGAKGLLVNIISSGDISIGEFNEIGDIISSEVDENATIVIGSSIDGSLGKSIKVTIVASGVSGFYHENNNKILNKELNENNLKEKHFLKKEYSINKRNEDNNESFIKEKRFLNDVSDFISPKEAIQQFSNYQCSSRNDFVNVSKFNKTEGKKIYFKEEKSIFSKIINFLKRK